MSEDVSRRKALSLLGFGAALGFTLSAALAPSEAEAQWAATPPPGPRRGPCRGHRDPRDEPPPVEADGPPRTTPYATNG